MEYLLLINFTTLITHSLTIFTNQRYTNIITYICSNAPRKLSDRFDRIVHSQAVAKPVRGQNQNNKGKKVVIVQKGSNPKNGAKGAAKGGKGGKGANAPQGKKDNKKKDGKNGKAAAKPVKEKPKTADELDLEMATCKYLLNEY
jgi:hypothetical protein